MTAAEVVAWNTVNENLRRAQSQHNEVLFSILKTHGAGPRDRLTVVNGEKNLVRIDRRLEPGEAPPPKAPREVRRAMEKRARELGAPQKPRPR
jgi:hypothetical protein